MEPMHRAIRRLADDRRGVALPLALLGLISVSLLVTTALVTSSTELAISSAHQDATQALYLVEGGLQAYVAENGTVLLDAADDGEFDYTAPGSEDAVFITVNHLGTQTVNAAGDQLAVFTVRARPTDGRGREVMTMVKQILPAPQPFDLDIQSALALGGSFKAGSNSWEVNGRNELPDGTQACQGEGLPAMLAVKGVEIDPIPVENPNHNDKSINFKGATGGADTQGKAAVVQTFNTKSEIEQAVLKMTLDELISKVPASHQYRTSPGVAGDTRPVWDRVMGADEKVVVVDGSKADGTAGDVVLESGGAGIIIVKNGNLLLARGNATFSGIVIAEGHVDLQGGQTINGAVVALGRGNQNGMSKTQIDGGGSRSNISYNKCKTDEALLGLAELVTPRVPEVQGSFAWMEVVR